MLLWFYTGVSGLKFQIRRLNQVSSILEAEMGVSFDEARIYFLKLQANPTVHQREISKLSSYYKNLSSEQLSERSQLNSALYFLSVFCKNVPSKLIEAAHFYSETIELGVLRILGQKLFRLNQWPIAEKIINKKFKTGGQEESFKFEVYALNGNFRKMIEQLPHMAKSEIPQEIYYLLLNLVNFKDGNEVAKVMKANPNFCYANWRRIIQMAMKGKLLSKKPMSFEVFLRQAEALSSSIGLEPSLLLLALNRCDGIDQIQSLNPEQINQFKTIFKAISREKLILLAKNLKSFEKKLPADVSSTILSELCQNSFGTDEEVVVLSSLLCWIIKYYPENYSYDLLMSTEFSQVIDDNVARAALESIGLNNENVMKFIEFCLLKREIFIAKGMLKDSIDIAIENFSYEPSDEFIKFIHRKGYNLSSKFYLRRLKQIIQGNTLNSYRAFECFKLISVDSLHGELLQEYLRLSRELLELMMNNSNLDKCHKIYSTIEKYQLFKSPDPSKSFNEFVLENLSNGKFKQPFKATKNMECIKAILDSIQQQKLQRSSSIILNEKFCLVALQASLCNFDFSTASRLRVHMNNCGYSDGGISFSQNVLKQWSRKLE